MKAMRLTGIRQMAMMEVPTPSLTHPSEVLIRMTRVGVCGSDVHYYTEGQIGSQVVEYPYTVGHEGAGIVHAVGPAVTRVKPGDRIAIEPAISCGQCDQCLAGRQNTCRHLRFLGCPGQAEGCLAEFLVMPESNCFPITASMTDDEAALSEPLAIGTYACKQSVPLRGAAIGILGAGPIGLSVLLSARSQGAQRIYITDNIASRRDLALRAGAMWAGDATRGDVTSAMMALEPAQLDVIFECCGQQEALDQGIELLKPGGKLMLIGIPPTLERVSFLIDKLRRKEICIQNVRRQNHCLQSTLNFIASRVTPVGMLVTHHFPFSDTKKAFDMVASYEDGVMKAMIEFA
jgi:L-iditol 2-dehydrogenase